MPTTMPSPRPQFSREQWAKFPMDLRKRWWHETAYGGSDPSENLKEAIRDALVAQQPQVVDPSVTHTSEEEVLTQYSSPGLRTCELDRAGKKAHLARIGIRGEDAERILNAMYPLEGETPGVLDQPERGAHRTHPAPGVQPEVVGSISDLIPD